VYEGGRHEMLSEINRDEVMQDIGGWMEQILTELKSEAALS
jgi:alpha-beta hydrolase superfamily lysophospholipase